MREWHPILHGWRWLEETHAIRGIEQVGDGFSTPCEGVSTPGITIFVAGLSELYTC